MKKFLIVKPKSKKLYFKDLDLGRCYNHRYTHPPTHHPKLFIANILKNSTLFQLVLLFLKIKNKSRFPPPHHHHQKAKKTLKLLCIYYVVFTMAIISYFPSNKKKINIFSFILLVIIMDIIFTAIRNH